MRAWWPGNITGITDQIGESFTYTYPVVHRSVQKVVELNNTKIVWEVTEAELSSVEPTDEWVGTEIVFDVNAVNGGSKVAFTHRGLAESFECYDSCSNAWSMIIGKNLRTFIETGEPQGDPFK